MAKQNTFIMTARLLGQIDSHNIQRHHTSALHLSVHARVDKGARIYVQSPKNGPEWMGPCRETGDNES
eukprot:5007859-Pyramimonas_sp.AAC.1